MRGVAAPAIHLGWISRHLGRDGGRYSIWGGRSRQGWLEIEMKKTARPDQVKPMQLKVSCPDFRVRVQPMHVTLLGRLQSIYFTYSGIAWERVQQVNEGAGFPHNLPTEVRHVVSSLGMPKVLMLLAEQHCDLAMRTDGTLRGDDPRTHPLGELCKASAQLQPYPYPYP